ncbi:TOMM precursor leader peptide-binding protein [Priestia megaterium]|nr:TOMM precursor leader peptide-binding protein [Priestia megaterium]
MGARVLIVGEGLVADCVYEKVHMHYPVVRQADFEKGIPKDINFAVVLHDAWNPSIHYQAEEIMRSCGTPWIRGFISFGEGVIGPFVQPDKPGCSQCADVRRLIAGYDRKEMWTLQQRFASQEEIQCDAWASRTGILQMSAFIEKEIQLVLEGDRSSLDEKLFLLNLKTLKSSSHIILPDPLCSLCSQLPEDSAKAAEITLQSSPKISEDNYRCRPISELKTFLVKDYLDYRTGLMNGKRHDYVLPFADVVVNMPLFAGDEGVAGRTHSYEASELTSILEGLERYCGIQPHGKRTAVHDSYQNLKDKALNPIEVGIHAEKQYSQPDCPFKPLSPNRPINWVWGYSFLQKQSILVPELLAYYSLGCGDGFVYETSNGCALGGSLEEAIFHGILEVVERDSFLITWYAQLSLPRLDIRSACDKELQLMVDRVRSVAGYDLHFFNSTMEHGIPSIWAIAKNRKETGMNLICAAGAHPDPIKAVKSAIHELAGMMPSFDGNFEANRKNYEKLLHDSSLVKYMEHHGMLYGLPQAEERLQFLLDENGSSQTFEEAFTPQKQSADLTNDLHDILEKFRELNLEVIVVDQTAPAIKRNGLYCVKVLIPGMLPMTFGHHLTRLEGLERVLRVPVELGYKKQLLTLEELNPHPHPFP